MIPSTSPKSLRVLDRIGEFLSFAAACSHCTLGICFLFKPESEKHQLCPLVSHGTLKWKVISLLLLLSLCSGWSVWEDDKLQSQLVKKAVYVHAMLKLMYLSINML